MVAFRPLSTPGIMTCRHWANTWLIFQSFYGSQRAVKVRLSHVFTNADLLCPATVDNTELSHSTLAKGFLGSQADPTCFLVLSADQPGPHLSSAAERCILSGTAGGCAASCQHELASKHKQLDRDPCLAEQAASALPTPSPAFCWCMTSHNCTAPHQMAPRCMQQPFSNPQPASCSLTPWWCWWTPPSCPGESLHLMPHHRQQCRHTKSSSTYMHSLPWHADGAHACRSGAQDMQVQGIRSGTSCTP